MNDLAPGQINIDTEYIALANQIRVAIRLELENAPIRALHLPAASQSLLQKAGFQTIAHIVRPTPVQLSLVANMGEPVRQEIRDKLLWAIGQANQQIWRQLMQAWRNQYPRQPVDLTLATSPKPDSKNTMPEDASPTPIIPSLLLAETIDIDQLIDQRQLFSRRIVNALMRTGVVTLRLLVMHTPEQLLLNTRNLGEKGLAEIEARLADWGLSLAATPSKQPVRMYCMLALALFDQSMPRHLSTLTSLVNKINRSVVLDEVAVARGARAHPYIAEVGTDFFQFDLRLANRSLYKLPQTESTNAVSDDSLAPDSEKNDSSVNETTLETTPLPEFRSKDGKLILHELWGPWFATLTQQYQEIITWRHGITGDDPLTLKEVSERVNLSRERVRQLERKALPQLLAFNLRHYWQPLRQHLTEAVQQADGLLLPGQWEHFWDERVIWEGKEARPMLLSLLCAVFEEFHFLNTDGFMLATYTDITATHLRWLDGILKQVLRPHKQEGLTLETLAQVVQEQFLDEFPTQLGQPTFIRRAIDLFERVSPGPNGRYIYLRRPKLPLHPSADSGWAGKPGTRLYEWEQQLRHQFENVAWAGQLALSEKDFYTLCQAIREEAQEPNYFTKLTEGQPRLVPPAVFITTMVFSARYAEQTPDEAIDEFWTPYLRTVWGVMYSQAFMSRCRKRFRNIVPYLEQIFGFEFPRRTEGDVVIPIYRHALIPRYMQTDFAQWLRKGWRDILVVAQTPKLLANQLLHDRSLDYYSQRLKQFVTGKATAETAAALIGNMAAAISLHVNDGETIESISDLLAGTPIEQELWREIAQEFQLIADTSLTPLRQTQPRLTWVWSLDDEELALRVQNIILPAESDLQGEPDRLVWLETAETDPRDADIEVEVSPWRMKTGERIINDVFLNEPDGPVAGQLVLLTDADELATRLDIPPYPNDEVQFFRLTQQGAYGIPVRREQVSDGTWLVCARQPLTFLDGEGETIEADTTLSVPYPLDESYRWAVQFSLNLPVTVKAGSQKLLTLADSSDAPAIGQPTLNGEHPVAGLSRQVQPTFASTSLTLTVAYGGERLLKQASLWLHGQDGWRYQRPLAELRQKGIAGLDGAGLELDLSRILPAWANNYTLELRFSLQPIFPVPLQFAIVPGLVTASPPPDRLYTPVNPPQLILRGVSETAVVRHAGMSVALQPDGSQHITWTDLRHEPRLILRFDKVDIPLMWPVKRFMAWLEPKPTRPFLTLDELRQTTLHAIGTHDVVPAFKLFVLGQRYREFALKRGRFQVQIGQSQLYDMVRLPGQQHTVVKVQVGLDAWVLFEVRLRPQLSQAHVEYDNQEKTVRFSTGLDEPWNGQARFVAESLSNPFVHRVELHQTNSLKDLHLIPADLPNGVYLLRLELDGADLSLAEQRMRFSIGEADLAQEQQLVEAIRSGQIISPRLAEDFVLWWAEIAEAGETPLTPATLYQLATIPAAAARLEKNFMPHHLQKLWAPLVSLQAVQNQSEWLGKYGYLPAWIILPMPLILKTVEHGLSLRIFPICVARCGREGYGYGHWQLSHLESARKERVYVRWQPVSLMQVRVQAWLLDNVPYNDWTTIDIDKMYDIYHCSRCGRLTGAMVSPLPVELKQAHKHGRNKANLRTINSDDYQLLAELISERRGQTLVDIYEQHGVLLPPATYWRPEPPINAASFLQPTTRRLPLMVLTREIKRYGLDEELPLWTSAARMLMAWERDKSVTPVGQEILAFCILLRTAAYRPQAFRKLRKETNLSETDCQQLLAEINQTTPDHLEWGLTLAELLWLHSPKK